MTIERKIANLKKAQAKATRDNEREIARIEKAQKDYPPFADKRI